MHPQPGDQSGAAQPWSPPPQQAAPGPARRPRFSWMGLFGAVVAAAALAVAIIALIRSQPVAEPSSSVPAATASATTTAAAQDTSAADRALCTAIAPLMGDYDRTSNAWLATGQPGTPARDAALPKYRSDTEEWARRSQEALDGHPSASAFFKRTLQRFIDDRILLVRNMEPGPTKPPDDQAWADSMTAYEGPLSVCYPLGVTW
jgi:hypothetical protein